MKNLTFAVAFLFSQIALANDFLPSVIYKLDARFTHHVIVVEKSTHTLYLYQYDEPLPRLLKKYQIATGKIIGNKKVQGDKKTPEGVYFFQNFHSAEDLIKKYGETGLIYGAGAFTTNYPNIIDRMQGKTGGGIWLHSTDDDSRVQKGLDSRGCVVAIDEDLKDISQYIDLTNTPVVIVQDLAFLSEATWQTNKEELLGAVESWSKAWVEKDFETYINSYSPTEFTSSKGGYQAYKRYKRAVFARDDKPIIDFRNISALTYKNYAVVTIEQDYSSDVIQDIGKKTLYLKKDENYQWKIVFEGFQKIKEQSNIAFTPSMRFFETVAKKKEIANDSGSI
ncbi:MAG: hypothetical protein CME62_01910 [Halobacteriovoraceae bacterium]|nr:hypothetical protein [Halobacteriovoraceae bacterium]|tara:strand:- start:20099 stop:21109 length:1011 start_codon:yes stop_codon:yes gene_type:complete